MEKKPSSENITSPKHGILKGGALSPKPDLTKRPQGQFGGFAKPQHPQFAQSNLKESVENIHDKHHDDFEKKRKQLYRDEKGKNEPFLHQDKPTDV